MALPKTPESINLQLGETKMYHHLGCNNRETSKSLSVTRKSNGLVWNCFKCSSRGFHSTVGWNPPQTMGRTSRQQSSGGSVWFPPVGSSTPEFFSDEAREYLRRYFGDREFSPDEVREQLDQGGASRVWFRTARGCQGRLVSGVGPKWVSKSTGKDFFLAGRGDLVVITEDVISAMLVAQHTAAFSTLGTFIHDEHLSTITRFKYAAIWYDDDSGIVQKQQLRACVKLQAYMPCTVVHTGTDPKNIPERIPDIIQELLEYFQ